MAREHRSDINTFWILTYRILTHVLFFKTINFLHHHRDDTQTNFFATVLVFR